MFVFLLWSPDWNYDFALVFILLFSHDHFNWMDYRWDCLDPLILLDAVCPSWLMIGHFLSAMKFACGSSIFEWWSRSSAPHGEGEVGLRERSHFQIVAKQAMTCVWLESNSWLLLFLSAYWVVGNRTMEFYSFPNRIELPVHSLISWHLEFHLCSCFSGWTLELVPAIKRHGKPV